MQRFKAVKKIVTMLLVAAMPLMLAAGCVSVKADAEKDYSSSVSNAFGDEYYVPERPTDNPCIGCWLSPQYGLQEGKGDIETINEKSHSSISEDEAFSVGMGLLGSLIAGPGGELGAEGGRYDRANFQGMEIIKPAHLALVDFKPGVPRVMEAIRLKFYSSGSDKHNRLSVGASGSVAEAGVSGTAQAGVGRDSESGVEGEGLVVAYKFMELDAKSLEQKSSGNQPLELDKKIVLDGVEAVASAEYINVRAGSGNPLPMDIWWACDEAESMSDRMVAAWVVTIEPMTQGAEPIVIGFPAFPEMKGCSTFQSVIDGGIEMGTDRIWRGLVKVTVLESEVNDRMQPVKFSAVVNVTKESYKLRVVDAEDLPGAKKRTRKK